jgi:hypothetical protein
MHASAEVELQHRVELYKFLLNLYVKAILFCLAIAAFTVKIALDDGLHRRPFAVLGMGATLAMSVPIVSGLIQEREWRRHFKRLAKATDTEPISTAPLITMIIGSAVFWVLIMGIFLFLYLMGNAATPLGHFRNI